MPYLPVRGDGDGIDDVVAEIQIELAIRGEHRYESGDVLRVHLTGVISQLARDVERRDDRDVVSHHRFSRHAELAVASLLPGEVDDHRTRAHGPHRFRAHEHWRRLPRHKRGGDDHVRLQRAVVDQLLLAPNVLLAQLPGVAARVLGVFEVDVELDERRPQALHLFLDDGPGVERLDYGTDAPRCGDRLESSNSSADDEHTRGTYRSRRGH